jgi:hypothetical protein
MAKNSIMRSEFPKILFILKSTTIKFEGYDFKNIPTSTGRADVVARFIQAVMCSPKGSNGSDSDMGVWILLNEKFISELNTYYSKKNTPFQPFSCLVTSRSLFQGPSLFQGLAQSEIKLESKTLLSEIEILKRLYSSFEKPSVNTQNTGMFEPQERFEFAEVVEYLQDQDYSCFILQENVEFDLLKTRRLRDLPANATTPPYKNQKLAFIIGDQLGFLTSDLEELQKLQSKNRKITHISIGINSQLASSVVTLIKWILMNFRD